MRKKGIPPRSNISDFKDIIDRLACPVCLHQLEYSDTKFVCTDMKCHMSYPVVNEIPILINEADSLFSIDNYLNAGKNLNPDKIENLKKRFKNLVPSLSNNLSSKKNFKLLNELLSTKTKPKILIVGGGEITTNTNLILNETYNVVESDIYFGPRTSVVIDSHSIPFMNESFDLVIFQAVLEHVLDPQKCVGEAHRVLKSDGYVFAATPFLQAVHMKQFDFTRFTHLGHRRLFRSFEEIESGVFAGTGVVLGWSIRYFVRSLSNKKVIRLILELIVSFMFFWLKYIDFITKNKMGSYDGASGFYFIGKKSDSDISDRDLIKLFRGTK